MKNASDLAAGDRIYVAGVIRVVASVTPAGGDQIKLVFEDKYELTECQNKRFVVYNA